MPDIKEEVAELEATEKSLLEKKAELDKVTADTEAAKQVKSDQLSGMDKELERVQKAITDAKEERRKQDEGNKSVQQRLRNENLEVAKDKFFVETGVKPEDQAKFLEEFHKFDSGAINSDLIIRDMKKTFASLHADELLELQQKVIKLSEGSDEFKAALSSSGFSGAGREGPSGEKGGLDADDMQAAQWAGIPLEKYRELKKQGRV